MKPFIQALRGWLPIFAVFALLTGSWSINLPREAATSSGRVVVAAAIPARPYLVRLARPNLLVTLKAGDKITDEVNQRQRDELGGILAKMAADGLAGPFVFEEAELAFRVELADRARVELSTHPLVAGIEPQTNDRSDATSLPPVSFSLNNVSIQSVSSVNFIQVYSPFVWGRTSVGGLSVQATLEYANGTTKGVAYQTTRLAPKNYIKIDRTQLYYETYFVDPNNALKPVNILPGDRVHVVTAGIDPETGLPATDDRRIAVDDVQAWTSYEQDRVSGIAPPNSTVIVTTGTFLYLSQYLTPGSGVTYAETTSGVDGRFSVSNFRSSTDPIYKKMDLKQGSTGFVRVRHVDGSEVYSVHGQNVFVLENSYTVHGYAFSLPNPPTTPQLDEDVATVQRPAPTVSFTLKDSGGQVKSVATAIGGGILPYDTDFSSMISGGDIVEYSINEAPTVAIAVAPLTANVDLSGNQLIGSGPANTQLVISGGRINGYIAASSQFSYIEQRVTTNGVGNYVSGQFQCGTGNVLSLQPGSFGYVGFEEGRGNFVYMSYAAPTNHVMVDYSFLEGWIENGAVRPTLTLRDSQGVVKHQETASPILLWMTTQRLFINTYYQVTTSQYITPEDIVNIASGGKNSSITVDKVTAFLDPDTEAVVGEAPAGASVRVIPAKNLRADSRDVIAGSNGSYTAGNPYEYLSYSCAMTQRTEDFQPGESGRAYVRHADGNAVYAVFGRSMHVNENENYVELYQSVWHDLDWEGLPPARTASVTLTPKQGAPLTVQAKADVGHPGKTKVYFVKGLGEKVLIRPGDSISATFEEGPDGLTRSVTMVMNGLALVTGSPDLDTSTLAGVGPRGWSGQAVLNSYNPGKTAAIPPSGFTAYSPLRFLNAPATAIQMVRGYAGTVSFSDREGHRLWTAWAVTAFQVKILGWLKPGDTRVCGKATPESTVTLHDVTDETQDILIGAGPADIQGNFCLSVNSLVNGQVIMAEANGTFSQPVIVREIIHLYLPLNVR